MKKPLQGKKQDIASLVKKIRKERGLSQKELAELCGISSKTIERLENIKTEYIPKLDAIYSICKKLRCMNDLKKML